MTFFVPLDFPGSNAGASLKPQDQAVGDGCPIRDFPGSNAGASLKQVEPHLWPCLDAMTSPAAMPGPH